MYQNVAEQLHDVTRQFQNFVGNINQLLKIKEFQGENLDNID